MRDKKNTVTRDRPGEVVDRWQVLMKLGALAITSPVIVSWGDEGSNDAGFGRGGAGRGGTGVGRASTSNASTGTASARSAGAGDESASSAGIGGESAGSAVTGGGGAGAGGVGAGGADAIDPRIFENGASCSLIATDIEAPYFIDDSEIPNDINLFRSDLRDGHRGCEFRLYLRLLDGRSDGEPIPDAEVYIWHCDADGRYSGLSDQDPPTPHTGTFERAPEHLDRFCRGVQLTDRNGIVGFTSIWPGWDGGRPVHVHLVARINGETTRLITTQLHFDAEFSRQVYKAEPAYAERSTSLPASSLNPPGDSPAMPRMRYTRGLVTGILNIIVDHA
ncbi:protocatechuate 3,4-dioxygenase [Sorangium sp. So ce861]|uniref:dioxygenase family protein n=1 Tax=Sorangium sp. So ce861 TaxID=3133323 RepID=UPI003F5DDB85